MLDLGPRNDLTTHPELTVVIPTYNEEDSVLPLARALHHVLVGQDRSFEILFVDDGSTDSTPVRLEEILHLDARVRVVQLVHNAGQTAALCAGIENARGKYIVAMDADLQNDPTDIPKLIAKLDDGYDVVSGWRRDRKDRFVSRRVPSVAANAILSWVSGVKLHDFGCTLKAYRAEFLQRVPLYSDMHRYLPAFAKSMGARVAEVEVKHHPRRFGESKYGMGRIYRVVSDIVLLQLLVHFAFRPLHWFGRVSVMALLLVSAILLSGNINLPEITVGPTQIADEGAREEAEYPTIVFPAIMGLGLYLATTLLSLGFLCELVNRTGDTQMKQLFTVLDARGGTARG